MVTFWTAHAMLFPTVIRHQKCHCCGCCGITHCLGHSLAQNRAPKIVTFWTSQNFVFFLGATRCHQPYMKSLRSPSALFFLSYLFAQNVNSSHAISSLLNYSGYILFAREGPKTTKSKVRKEFIYGCRRRTSVIGVVPRHKFSKWPPMPGARFRLFFAE